MKRMTLKLNCHWRRQAAVLMSESLSHSFKRFVMRRFNNG